MSHTGLVYCEKSTLQIVLMAHYKNLLIHMAHICENDMFQKATTVTRRGFSTEEYLG